jgi:flagellar FliJ protein
MKKFVFTLETLLKVKKTIRDKLRAEYAVALTALNRAKGENERLDRILEDESKAYERRAKKGITVSDFEARAMYLNELQCMISSARQKLSRARDEEGRSQAALAAVHKEIKVLEKLRRKQYLEYLAEEEKRETGAREDILSFHMTEKAAGGGRTAASP